MLILLWVNAREQPPWRLVFELFHSLRVTQRGAGVSDVCEAWVGSWRSRFALLSRPLRTTPSISVLVGLWSAQLTNVSLSWSESWRLIWFLVLLLLNSWWKLCSVTCLVVARNRSLLWKLGCAMSLFSSTPRFRIC